MRIRVNNELLSTIVPPIAIILTIVLIGIIAMP